MHLFRQTKYIVMMTKEESNKVENFMTPGAGVLLLWGGHISHLVKMYFSLKFLFSTLGHDPDKLSV